MYCVVGTRHDDPDHAYNDDKTMVDNALEFGSSACGDTQPDPRNPNEEQISYDICDAMLAKNAANIADLRAEAAAQEAAKAALKAGLTCLVDVNCIQPADGSPACIERPGFTGYTCQFEGR